MITFEHTTGLDPRSLALRTAMDTETHAMYVDDMSSMDPEARAITIAALDTQQADLVEVVIALDDGEPVGHAALRVVADGGLEVKKVFVAQSARGRGLARRLMAEVEQIAREQGHTSLRLQTGPKQLEAIALYRAIGYRAIEAFGPYVGLDDMEYFERDL